MKAFLKFFQKLEPDKAKHPFWHTVYDGFYTFVFTPDSVNRKGVHIRDGMDLKRTMIFVVYALILSYIFGTYNIGHQHFSALGIHTGLFEAIHLKIAIGLIQVIPILAVSYLVGLGIEFYYASRKGHGIEEGYLVSGALIPLIMPPDLPIWILVLSIVFAVIIGKEAFGGTGMNIWNVALLSRVFVFFAYPTSISGDEVWVSSLTAIEEGAAVEYGWWHSGFFNGIFKAFGWTLFDSGATVVDSFTGATPLALAYQGGWESVSSVYSVKDLFWGTIPGSVGETCKPFIIIGGLFLLFTRIASWRIMLSGVLGAFVMAILFNLWGATPYMDIPWYYQFWMGSFLFAVAFMATDPVTASGTNRGKWIYGFLIGIFGMLIRVVNPAYPEGWMLAILLMNTFAPLIDHYVLQSNIKKRLKRA